MNGNRRLDVPMGGWRDVGHYLDGRRLGLQITTLRGFGFTEEVGCPGHHVPVGGWRDVG